MDGYSKMMRIGILAESNMEGRTGYSTKALCLSQLIQLASEQYYFIGRRSEALSVYDGPN
jgi:hypothetical protein